MVPTPGSLSTSTSPPKQSKLLRTDRMVNTRAADSLLKRPRPLAAATARRAMRAMAKQAEDLGLYD